MNLERTTFTLEYSKMMELEQHLPYNTAMDTYDLEEGVQGFWEGLKQKLDNELTDEDLKRITLLMKDKIGKESIDRPEIENPSDLLNILENNMLIEDALSTVEHVFNIMDHHPEFEEKSFGQLIRDHMIARKRFGCPNIIGREKEISDAINKLNSSNYKDTCILLDNIEDVYQSNPEEVLHILRRCLDGPAYMPIKWIVTSRITIGTEIDGMEQVELQPLQRNSAEKLLKLSLRPIELTDTQCQILLDMAGEIPLAIRLLSSAVKSRELNYVTEDMLKPLLHQELQTEMKGCIEYSYHSLKESEKNQLHLLSVVETSQFDIQIVTAVLEIEEPEALFLMMKLTNRHIVQRAYTGQKGIHYCLHPLIFEYVHNLPKHEQFSMQAQNNFCKHMLERIEPFIANIDRNYSKAVAKVSDNRSLLKVMLRVLSMRNNDRNDLLSVNKNRHLSKLQEMFHMTHMEKAQFYQNIIKQMQSEGRQHSSGFWKLEEIQMMVDCQRFYEAKEEISVLEKTLFNEIHDDESSAYLKGRFWFVKGRLYRCRSEKQLHEAIECFKKSLNIYEIIENVPDAAKALNAIVNAYFDSGDYDSALHYHNEAADRLRNFSSDNLHPDIAVYEFNVGTIYLAKARQELSIYKCDTEDANEYFKQALQIFKDSMAKDVQIGTDRMPNYAHKLSEKSKALFYLKQFEEAIIDMKRSLEIKIAPFKSPDQNITLAYFNTGSTFIIWREEVKTYLPIAKLLLKEAIHCYRYAEDEIRSDGSASLTGRDKLRFISSYKKIANEVKKDEAKRIKSFCEHHERGVTFDSSSSSESTSGSETSSPSRQDHSDSDEGIHSDDNANDQPTVSDYGISSVESEKRVALQFEQDFFSKINAQLPGPDNRKRRRPSTPESD